jgi:hypothetical protein|tara:strand:+ start:321 stop:632 length:312 start_codon:yes stop_codon:yes gene_type:complete
MFIYNVTTHVELSIESQWIDWMNVEYLPKMMKTGKFNKVVLFKVVTEEDIGGISYATQYHCSNRDDFERYLSEDALKLRNLAVEKFGERILSFNTELEQITSF